MALNSVMPVSMTVRVALSSFRQDLMTTGLGDDDLGKDMVKAYDDNIHTIYGKMLGRTVRP